MDQLMEIFQLLLLLGSMALITSAEDSLPPYCTRHCGHIIIESPFGIENGCFRGIGFKLSCVNNSLSMDDGTVKIRQIDMQKGILYIEPPMVTMELDQQNISTEIIDLKNLPFSFNLLSQQPDESEYWFYLPTHNLIYLVGCSTIANVVNLSANNTIINSCFTMCVANGTSQQEFFLDSKNNCSFTFHHTNALGIKLVRLQLIQLNEQELRLVNTSNIMTVIVDITASEHNFFESLTKGNNTGANATLAWYINDGHPTCKEAKTNTSSYACLSSNSDCYNTFYDYNSFKNSTSIGYICRCSSGYQGNPYVSNGCQGANFTSSPAKECASKCGRIDIPFPFGLKKGCYWNEFFHLECNQTTRPPTLIFKYYNEVVKSISLENGELETNDRDYDTIDKNRLFTFVGSKYIYNWVIAYQSCEIANSTNYTTFACIANHSHCVNVKNTTHGEDIIGYRCSCSKGYQGNPYLVGGCTDIDECKESKRYICHGVCNNTEGDYNCTCPLGLSSRDPKQEACIRGPPKPKKSTLLLGIMIGISSGICLLILCAIFFTLRSKFIKKHEEKMRERYFHQNHGLLLKQLISSGEDVAERTKIFSLKEIEKATNNFDKTRVLGRGGHGTVYKGILSDQRVVAIKKSKIVRKSEIDQFINEVAILSQINHRHIVKLFGCCLETEVPLLIYEFISNGALSEHLHIANGNSTLSWEDRLRIATEAAGALAYLHSAASISILHRDVKSSNILLDDHFAAKVSDFGASRFIPLDQTHIITAIQGTFGYLDPEYYQTSQLTQKSDVYSFGVILLELLTGKKPIYTTEDEQDLNLSMHFLQALRSNRSFDLMEDRIIKESNEEELNKIIQLIQMCLKLKGVDRPTMKEVEYKLQSLRKIRMKKKGHYIPKGDEETEYLLNATSYASSDGTSRNYSMEKEVMWSQHYPR